MKTTILSLIALLVALTLPARAQYSVVVVADPVETADHIQDLAQWAQSIQALNTQIQQFNQYIQIGQTVEGYIGNPAAAAQAMSLQLLGATGLTPALGQLTSNLDQTVDGAKALENTGSQLFSAVPNQTPGGFSMNFSPSQFTNFSAIQNQNANVDTVIQNAVSQIHALQQQKSATLAQIKSAPDQSTVQKLSAQANAIDGQIAALGQQQQTATDQIVTQQISNQNDTQMKAKAANQATDHEMNVSLQNLMQWQGQVTSDRTDFK